MQTAYNPDTGDTLVLVDNEWVKPAQIAKNDAGEAAYLINNQWVLPGQAPKPPEPTGIIGQAADYIGDQAGILKKDIQVGLINTELAVKQAQLAEKMNLQEGRINEFGPVAQMPEVERKKHLEQQKSIEKDLLEVAKLSTDVRGIQATGGRKTTAEFQALPQQKEYQEGDFWKKAAMTGEAFIKDPLGIATDIGLQSLPQSLAVAATAVAARIGQINPKATAAAGGATSAMAEFGGIYADLREQGIPHKEAWEQAGIKSGVIGLFDAASFGSAGNAMSQIAKDLSKGSVKGTAKTVGKEISKQAALGASGEALGSTAINQEIDPVSVLSEAVGEVFGAPGEAIATYRGQPKTAPTVPPTPAPGAVPPTGAAPVEAAPPSISQDTEAMIAELMGQQPPVAPVTAPPVAPEAAAPVITPEQPVAEKPQTAELIGATTQPVPEINTAAADQNNFIFMDKGNVKSIYGQVVTKDGKDYVQYRNEKNQPRERLLSNKVVVNPTPEHIELLDLYKAKDQVEKIKDNFIPWLKKYGIKPSEKADMGIEKSDKELPVGIFRKEGYALDDLALAAINDGILTENDLQEGVGGVESMRNMIYDALYNQGAETPSNMSKQAELYGINQRIQELETALEPAPEEAVAEQAQEAAAEKEAAAQFAAEYREGTAEEQAQADYHAQDVKGQVVYQKGNIALIRGYDRNGRPVYVPTKGNIISNFDVDSYKGTSIPASEVAKLSNIKKKLEELDKKEHETKPFIKFNKAGLDFSSSVSPQLRGIISEWKKLLNIKQKIYVATVDDVLRDKNKYTGPHRAIGSAVLKSTAAGSTRNMDDGSRYIVVKTNVSPTELLETIAHEMGHAHEKEAFVNAPKELQDKIYAEHEKWVLSQKGKSAKELVDSMRARKSAKTSKYENPMMPAEKMARYRDYWISFGEWYADQVSRWATTSDKPVTAVEKFFAKLGAAIKRFFLQAKNKKYLPNETFKQYLDGMATEAQVDLIADKLYKGQMALFSEKEVTEETNKVSDNQMDEVHNAQRYGIGLNVVPEDMMHWKKNHGINHSGKYQYAAEHIGDIVHRLSSTKENQGGGHTYGISAALDKSLRRYDFKDMLAQVRRNAEDAVKNGEIESVKKYEEEFRDAAYRYADAYEKVPVYTKFQELGKDAAIALGELNFPKVQRILNELSRDLQKSDVEKKYFKPLKNLEASLSERVVSEEPTPKVNKHRNIDGMIVSPVWTSPEVSKIDNLLYRLQDKNIDTKRVVQAIQKEAGQLDDKWNVYLKEELYHGRTSAALRKFLLQDLMPTIKQMSKLGITPDEMKEYLHNRHAKERNDQIAKIRPATLPDGSPNPSAMTDKGSGLSYKQIEDYFDKLDPAKAKKLKEVAQEFDKMIAGTQNILVASGAENQETIDAWNKTYKHYVPLFRVDDDFATHPSQGTGAGFSSSGGASKRATGSEKEVQDILGNILAQRERALIKAEKIRVGQALYGLAIKNPNPDFWLPINPDAVKNQDALAAELDSMGLDGQDIAGVMQEMKKPEVVMDRQTGLQTVRYKINPLERYKDHVFPVRVNGKDRYIFFNQNDPRAKRMVESMKNLDTEQLGAVLGLFGKFTRWFSAVNTQYNPVFGGINFLRDTGGAQFNLSTTKIAGKQGEVNAAIFPSMKAIWSTLKAERNGQPLPDTKMAKLWDEFKTAGGQTLYRDSLVRKAEEKQLIEHELNRLKRGVIRKSFSGAVQLLSDFNDTIENAVRLAAYKVAVDNKLSKEQAASIAKNLTVNFDRKGQIGSRVNALYAFFNASMQGSARLVETLRGPQGRKIVAGGILLGVAQSIALALAGFDEDEPPEFLKERNLVIPLGGKKYFLIPMPLGLHFIPTVGRVTTDFVLNGGKDAGKHVTSILGTALDAFNPLGGAGLSLQTLTPTIADPLAALEANKDAFGRPIYRADRATNPTPGYLRSRESASTVNKYIAEFLNYASGGTKYQKGAISPTADALDYLVGQFTGGLGREVMKVDTAVKSAVTGEELPAYRIPIAGRFYGDADSKAADSQRFYDNVTKIAGFENEIKGRRKNREDVAGFIRDNPQARLWQQANNAENQISELNRRKKDFQERGLPRDKILAIDNQKQAIMKRFNDRVKELE
jgi:hypothetical protein